MPRRWIWICTGGLAAVVLLGWLVFEVVPDIFAPEQAPGFGTSLEAKARSDVRTSALQLIGGLVLAIGAVFTAWSIRLTRERDDEQRRANEARIEIDREGQITERFTRAIDQLGSKELDVRLGGIYALERIARDSVADHGPILEVLTAYVREHASWPPRSESATYHAVDNALNAGDVASRHASETAEAADGASEAIRPATDVQAVVTVLGRRRRDHELHHVRLDLRSLDLRGIDLAHARLERANFEGTHLEQARLLGARLSGSTLLGTQIQDAVLARAGLDGAHLRRSQLCRAILVEADLEGASLYEANLEDANLSRASLVHANLRNARLVRAKLAGATLAGAKCGNADFEGADLQSASLEGAMLGGANLRGARLEMATFDERTRWPSGFKPLTAGARRSDANAPPKRGD